MATNMEDKKRSIIKNTGKKDRVMRIVVGVIIAGAGIYFKSWWALLALVPLITGLFGFCFLYHLLGIDTCKMKPGLNKFTG